ncbi:MAG: hypothetical protein AABY68_06185 [Pseudomonadota bacterium]
MSLFSVVFRALNKAATDFIEPRREDGHGSAVDTPTFVDTGLIQPTRPTDTQTVAGVVSLDAPSIAALQQVVAAIANFPASYPLPGSQVTALAPQTDALTNMQLRAEALPLPLGAAEQATLAQVLLALQGALTATISGEVEVKNDAGSPIPVSGPLSNAELRLSEVSVATSKEQEYIHFPFSVSAVGSPATYVMADPSKKLRLRDIVALDDPSNPQGAVISVKIGALEAHRGYAISKTQRKTGDNAGDTLTISVNKAAAVSGTAILEEVSA